MAADPPLASASPTVEMDLSDEMEPANVPLPVSPAPDIVSPAELDFANYSLPISPMPGGINSTGAATANPKSSSFLLQSTLSTRAKYGENGFAKDVSGSALLDLTESAEVVSTDSRDSGSTGSTSSKQVASNQAVSNVQASANPSDCESLLLGTTACSEKISGKAVQTNSRSPKAKLPGSAISVYRAIRDLLLRTLAFFGLVAPNSTVATSLPAKPSTTLESVDERSSIIGLPAEPSPIGFAVPDPSSAAGAPPLAHFIRDAEGWVHRFEGGIEISASRSPAQVAELPNGLTLDQARDTYKAILVAFKESSSCAEITDLLENVLLKLPTLQLSSCIGTGLGTFTAPHPYCRETPESSLIQLAALAFMLDVLSRCSAIEVNNHYCVREMIKRLTANPWLGRKFTISTAYIQDPAMNVLDEQLVTSLGFTVLHDPEAMNAMTPTTFLFAPNNEFPVVEGLLLVASPALYLGNELTFYCDNILYGIFLSF